MCHDSPMDPESILRALADERRREFDRVPVDKRVVVHRSAHAYLAGAVDALVRADLLDSQRGFALMTALVDPMTDILVASGDLERVTRSIHETGGQTAEEQ